MSQSKGYSSLRKPGTSPRFLLLSLLLVERMTMLSGALCPSLLLVPEAPCFYSPSILGLIHSIPVAAHASLTATLYSYLNDEGILVMHPTSPPPLIHFTSLYHVNFLQAHPSHPKKYSDCFQALWLSTHQMKNKCVQLRLNVRWHFLMVEIKNFSTCRDQRAEKYVKHGVKKTLFCTTKQQQ